MIPDASDSSAAAPYDTHVGLCCLEEMGPTRAVSLPVLLPHGVQLQHQG